MTRTTLSPELLYIAQAKIQEAFEDFAAGVEEPVEAMSYFYLAASMTTVYHRRFLETHGMDMKGLDEAFEWCVERASNAQIEPPSSDD